MRLLHTSDWHVGRVLHEHPLLPAQEQVFAGLVSLLAADPHDALIIAGDVFDRSVPSEESVRLFGRILRDLREACPAMAVVVIAGNHDSAARLAWASDLLESAGIHVRGPLDKLDSPVRVEGAGGAAQVWPIPFLWGGGMDAHDDGERRPPATQAGALEAALARIRTLQDPGLLQVAVAHCFVSGGATCDSERTLVGQATQVDGGLFDGFDHAALGHLHRRQQAAPRAWYSGSPLKYSFSEAGDVKAFLSVDLAPGREPRVTARDVPQPQDMCVLRGTLEDLLENPAHLHAAGRLCRVELTGAVAGVIPHAALRARFPHLLDLRIPEPESARGERGSDAERGDRARDLEEDFADFERHLHDREPGDALLGAFRGVREAAPREDPA